MGADTRYIVVRRTDIPNGTLQVLDLSPNESQRNLVYDPPGQTKYLNRFQNDTVLTVVGSGGSIRARGDLKGIGAYLIDHVEAGGLGAGVAAFTATQANAAAAALVAIANAGTALTLITVNAALSGIVALTELTNAGLSASTGSLEELLRIMAGAEYIVPNGSLLDTNGSTFNPIVSGSFSAGAERLDIATGYFMLSLNGGELAELKSSQFTYKGVTGAAVAIYSNTGAVL